MPEFSVKLINLRRAENNLEKALSSLEKAVERIEDVSNSSILLTGGASLRSIRSKVQSVHKSSLSLEQKMKRMDAALTDIAAVYERVEKAVLSHEISDVGIQTNLSEAAASIASAVTANYGINSNSSYSSDPVNLSNGNYVYEKHLMNQEGIAGFEVALFYNSRNGSEGIFGKGWSSNLEGRLEIVSEDQLGLIDWDASETPFARVSDGLYLSVRGNAGSIIQTENGWLYFDSKRHMLFMADGTLTLSSDRNGNGIYFLYGEDRELVGMRLTSGTVLNCEYEDGQLTAIADGGERMIHFAREGGNLSALTDEEGHVTGYHYDENGLLAELISPNGIRSLRNEYDTKARVVAQEFPDGGKVSYEYNEENHSVVYTEQNGNRIVYFHDGQGNNTRVVHESGEESSEYNAHSRRVSYTDRLGNQTRFGYDAGGNLSFAESANGDRVEVEYNGNHLPVRVYLNREKLCEASYDKKGNPLEWVDADGRNTSYEYNERGQITRVTNADGSVLRAEYDGEGNLIRLLHPAGGVEEYQYDSYHRVVASTDGNGNRTEYTYYLNNNIRTVTDAEGNETYYEYDANGNLTGTIATGGRTERVVYNAINKPAVYTNANGNQTRYEYDEMWNLVRRIDPNQAVTTYRYDREHRLVGMTDPLGNTEIACYDANGNQIARTSASGETWTIGYDGCNRPVKVTRPDGTVLSAEYDALGRVIRTVDADGNEAHYTYNFNGNMTSHTDESGYCREQEFDGMGNLTEVRDAEGVLASYTYYPGGALKTEEFADGKSFTYFYDAAGNVIRRVDESGGAWEYTYDCMNRLVCAQTPDLATEQYEYDRMGNVIAVIDREGNRTEYTYSLTGKPLTMKDALGNVTSYEYDCMDNLISIIQPEFGTAGMKEIVEMNGRKGMRAINIERDPMGNIIRQSDALSNTAQYFYDAQNRIGRIIDEDGNETSYEYDYDGQVKGIRYADGRTVRMQYSSLRHLQQMEDWNGRTALTHDILGRLLSVTGPDHETVSYGYNSRGQRTSLEYPDGMHVSYEYNIRGQLSGVQEGENQVFYSYYPNGNLEKKLFSNGSENCYEYNVGGMVCSLTETAFDGSRQVSRYEYDRMGRKSRVSLETENGQEEYRYEYDPVGSLTGVLRNGKAIRQYEYDAAGNRTRLVAAGQETTNRYNAAGQLVESLSAVGKRTYQYDRRGNLVREEQDGETLRQFVFGANGMIREAVSREGKAVYEYDGWRNRISRTISDFSGVGAGLTRYVRDASEVGTGNLLRTVNDSKAVNYVWDSAPLMESCGGQAAFYGIDPLGSVRYREDAVSGRRFGDIVGYDVFGMTDRAVAEGPGFAGYLPDPVSGLYHARMREYDPEHGRFTGKDPHEPLHLTPIAVNPYLYCKNDPLNRLDPDGRIFGQLAVGLIGAVGNVITTVVSNKISGTETTWQDVVGSATGGFVGGVLISSGVPPAVAGAASSAAQTLVTGATKKLSGADTTSSWGDIVLSTGTSAITGAVSGFAFSKLPNWISINGFNAGKGSVKSVFNQMVTKLANGTIKNLSASTFGKMLGYQAIVSLYKGAEKGIEKLSINKVSEAMGLNSSGVSSLYKGIKGLIKGDNTANAFVNIFDGALNLSCPLGA